MNDNHTEIGHDHIEPSIPMADTAGSWRANWTPSRRHFLTVTGLALGGAGPRQDGAKSEQCRGSSRSHHASWNQGGQATEPV